VKLDLVDFIAVDTPNSRIITYSYNAMALPQTRTDQLSAVSSATWDAVRVT
jgi:hypothetical protein